jgi:hypothetical protein
LAIGDWRLTIEGLSIGDLGLLIGANRQSAIANGVNQQSATADRQ